MSMMIKQYFTKSRLKLWAVIFLFINLIALTNFSLIMTSRLADGHVTPFKYPLAMEITGVYTILLLLPFLLWFFRRFPLRRVNLLRRLPVYLLISAVFGACHTGLMWVSRIAFYRLVGWGEYDYGLMGYRLLMEYHKQVITFWLIFGIVFFIDYARRVQEQKVKTAQLEEQLTRARLQALQMQLNPHFLFNTLNMISSTMYDDLGSADKMIAHLSDLLRITLKRSNRREYPLADEMELLKLYTEIMKARFRDKLTVRMEMGEGTHQALVPGFILQPLVENSIKHGMEGLEAAEIIIRSRRDEDRLVLEVTDNGPGVQGDPAEVMNSGIGITNTVERLEKMYGDEHTFHMESGNGDGLRVAMTIPLHIET